MGFFDEMNSKVSLNSKVSKLNASIKEAYSDLGVRYYNLYKDNPDPKFQELIDSINSAYAEIKQCEIDLALLRGVVFCPNCNSECSVSLKFCVKCGTKLIKPESEAPSVPVPQPTVPTEPSVTKEAVTHTAPETPSQEFKFCTNCGNKVSATAQFCTNCGKSFN